MSDPTNLPNPDGFLENVANLTIGPVSLRRIFLLLTRMHFSNPEHYGDMQKALGQFVWSKEDDKRTLHIDYDYNYTRTDLEQRPAVFVGVGDINYRSVALDNYRANTKDNSGTKSIYIGETRIIVRHISGTPDESLGLAELTAQFFMGISTMLTQHMQLHNFDVKQLLQTRSFMREQNQADQMFKSDVVMELAYAHDWTMVRESHRIKTVSFQAAVDGFSLPTPTDLEQ